MLHTHSLLHGELLPSLDIGNSLDIGTLTSVLRTEGVYVKEGIEGIDGDGNIKLNVI